MYYTYLLRCKDHSLYTGMTSDVPRRLREHCFTAQGARYTKSHPVSSLAAAWQSESRSLALRLEAAIKKLPKEKKESLLSGRTLTDCFGADFSVEAYDRVEEKQVALWNEMVFGQGKP